MPVKKSVKAKTKPGTKPKAKPKVKLPEKLIKYLESHGVKHELLAHRTVYTAFDVAATMKKKLSEVVKTLLVKADKDFYLVLLPADQNLDFKKLEKALSKEASKPVKSVKIPGEQIIADLLKVKAGAMSAFGGFHKLPVILENNLKAIKSAVFPSGSFNYSVLMQVKDYIELEKAKLGSFGIKKKMKPVKKVAVKKKKTVTGKRGVK